ncbi:MAG: RagB/SusD family nutrient uptake outer membrane protein [Mediterranea sp.]|jgi:hypothetical protein|nr:RagB/SusD family nutrient uptake outer membrane protein [Mediterranea sp.]
MKKKFLSVSTNIVSLFFLLMVSCNGLDQYPTGQFTEENYWSSTNKAMSVLNMAYNQMYNNGYFFNTESLSDNLYEGRGSSNEKIISSGQADAATGRFENEWKDCYAGIKTCHTFLENVDKVPNMDESLKQRAKAEARFIRAYLFFRLANWYGDVPLFEQDITLSESKTIGRTPYAEVIDFVRRELNDISQYLPTKEEYSADDNGRITSGAAIALNARTYLYANDWANVISSCERLIDGTHGNYSLFPDYEGLFLPENEYNEEVILDLSYVPSLKTWGNYFDYAPLSVGARVNGMSPTQELVDDYTMLNGRSIIDPLSGYDEDAPYQNRDPRLTATVVYHGFLWKLPNGQVRTIYIKPGSALDETARVDEYTGPGANSTGTGYYMRKYYDPTYTGSMNAGLNLILIRYGDILLMYAEAKNELGQMTEAIWNTTIRALRQRAGFTDAAALNYNSAWTQNDLRTIIHRERRVELALESLRIHDIRRWKTAETLLNTYPHGAKYGDISIDNGYIRLDRRNFNKDRDYLWAVPQDERDINPNLGQNPGY